MLYLLTVEDTKERRQEVRNSYLEAAMQEAIRLSTRPVDADTREGYRRLLAEALDKRFQGSMEDAKRWLASEEAASY
jgi:hypothetical protein